MNKDVFKKILANYKAKYEMINDLGGWDEMFKWIAVRTCQDNWDIDAPDFGDMLKKALGKTSYIIENAIKHPINGLLFLCDQGKAEFVRDEFRKLLSYDGDIRDRQARTEAFNDSINEMLNRLALDKWSYVQDRRDSIQYLAFINPAENYMFRSSAARIFADYVEFGNDIGTGKGFRLDHYYRLCDEVRAEIEADDEMMEMLDAKLTERAKDAGMDAESLKQLPGKLNIVVYDIMYCADKAGLYIGLVRPEKKYASKSSKAGKANDRKKRKEEMLEQIDSKKTEIEEILDTIPELPDFVGIELSQPYGDTGKVTEQDGNYIYIDFNGKNKTYVLPECIAKNYLTGADEAAINICKQIADSEEKIKKLKSGIRILEVQLSSIK